MSTLVPTICAPCAELLVSPAITEPHENLMPQYQFTKTPGHRPDGDYTCLECESIWELRFEKMSCQEQAWLTIKAPGQAAPLPPAPNRFITDQMLGRARLCSGPAGTAGYYKSKTTSDSSRKIRL